jgi:hypothetical protein
MIDKLKVQFDIVLMGAYLDESLVVLKNFLNWSLTDLVYISRKKYVDYGDISTQVYAYGKISHACDAYHTIPYHTIPYHTIPYHTIPYHTKPYHTIPYHTIPYHTIPYHTIPYQLHIFLII